MHANLERLQYEKASIESDFHDLLYQQNENSFEVVLNFFFEISIKFLNIFQKYFRKKFKVKQLYEHFWRPVSSRRRI